MRRSSSDTRGGKAQLRSRGSDGDLGAAVGASRSMMPALSFHGCPGLLRSETAESFVPAARLRAETAAAPGARHRLLSSNTTASLAFGRSVSNLSQKTMARSQSNLSMGPQLTAPGLARSASTLSSGKGKGGANGKIKRRALTQMLQQDDQRKREQREKLRAVTFHGDHHGDDVVHDDKVHEPPANGEAVKPALRRSAAGTGGSASSLPPPKPDTGGMCSPRERGAETGLDELSNWQKRASEAKFSRSATDLTPDAPKLSSAMLSTSSGDKGSPDLKKGLDKKFSFGTKVDVSSPFNQSDNLSTMSTATPPPSPRMMDSPGSPPLRHLRVLPSVPDNSPIAWETPSSPAMATSHARGGQQASGRGKPTATMGQSPRRALSPNANVATNLWRQCLDKEEQAKFYHKGVYPNEFDQQVRDFLLPETGGSRAPPQGPANAALTDRGVRLREGAAVRDVVRPRRARSVDKREVDEADFESFVHAAGCGCMACKPQNYAAAGLPSVDMYKEAVAGSGVRGRHMHTTQTPTAEQDEAFLRNSLGRRVKSADARAPSGMMPHRGLTTSERAAGDYERDTHERAVAAKHEAAKEHHVHHEEHRGRCCQVALVVNPRPTDPPPPPPSNPKADGLFYGEVSQESVRRAALANQEIFRFEPGMPQEEIFNYKARARSVPPELGEGKAAGADTVTMGARKLLAWQVQAPKHSFSSPRGERLNNSSAVAGVTDMFAAERRAQSERRARLQEDEPFRQLCKDVADISDKTRCDREALKSRMASSTGVASMFQWG